MRGKETNSPQRRNKQDTGSIPNRRQGRNRQPRSRPDLQRHRWLYVHYRYRNFLQQRLDHEQLRHHQPDRLVRFHHQGACLHGSVGCWSGSVRLDRSVWGRLGEGTAYAEVGVIGIGWASCIPRLMTRENLGRKYRRCIFCGIQKHSSLMPALDSTCCFSLRE